MADTQQQKYVTHLQDFNLPEGQAGHKPNHIYNGSSQGEGKDETHDGILTAAALVGCQSPWDLSWMAGPTRSFWHQRPADEPRGTRPQPEQSSGQNLTSQVGYNQGHGADRTTALLSTGRQGGR
jgi:hypothetical protein